MGLTFVLLCIISSLFAYSQVIAQDINKPVKAPVIFKGQTLFHIKARIGSLTPETRASDISHRLEKLYKDPFNRLNSITIQNAEKSTDILAGNVIIMSITDIDAEATGISRPDLTRAYIKRLQIAVDQPENSSFWKNMLFDIFFTVLATIFLVFAFKLFKYIFVKSIDKLYSWKGTLIHPIKIQNFEFFTVNRVLDVTIWLIKAIGITIEIALIYIYFTLVFSLFPLTAGLSQNLQNYFFSSLNFTLNAFINFIPNLFFITIVSIFIYYMIKLIKIIFKEIEVERISIPGFYSEWAEPTAKIVRFLIIAFGLVIILPYIPGWESEAFRGLSIFFGVIVSFGSSAAVANIIAGIILTYTRAFRVGDRLRIADTTGDVVERTLLVTRIRTIKSEVISIPNAVVLGSHIVNYSTDAPAEGLILHTTVSISYEASSKKVEELLIASAKITRNIKEDPTPFVLITKLNDFYISYEINAYTDKPTIMQNTYSDLHRNIHDKFNEAGIEIMSPHYTAVRDGNKVTIPHKYLPEDYQPSAFRVSSAEIFNNSSQESQSEE
ncbi:MAG: hypothetical protein A2287_06340 [Candidatus Melainabacteria bacterium RIFOXYA12_FULL_32_12]|nr:MAG: hypothetical protein A2255_04840 [Candidatus Melainabacteria bacterium RIFOXYA2_FULL_32_9]OGI24313.1 MAG: hypothetical protein A2287_06340 [Candidatus Melainabacteria bacterium RIFOXYA12_FULL_32_12]